MGGVDRGGASGGRARGHAGRRAVGRVSRPGGARSGRRGLVRLLRVQARGLPTGRRAPPRPARPAHRGHRRSCPARNARGGAADRADRPVRERGGGSPRRPIRWPAVTGGRGHRHDALPRRQPRADRHPAHPQLVLHRTGRRTAPVAGRAPVPRHRGRPADADHPGHRRRRQDAGGAGVRAPLQGRLRRRLVAQLRSAPVRRRVAGGPGQAAAEPVRGERAGRGRRGRGRPAGAALPERPGGRTLAPHLRQRRGHRGHRAAAALRRRTCPDNVARRTLGWPFRPEQGAAARVLRAR